jgi:hypothetical protein
MVTLFIIFSIMACIHLFYESVLLPSVRMSMRYKLFSLRDNLRMLKIENGDKFDNTVFIILEENINNAINLLPQITASYLINAKRIFQQDDKLRKSIEARVRKVDNCEIEGVSHISSKITEYITITFVWNSGAWVPYLIPVLLTMSFFSYIKEISKKVVFVKGDQYFRIHSYTPEFA